MATFNLTDASALFKSKYGKLSENVYNSANVLLGRMKKEYSFVGKEMKVPVPNSFAGGVGSGSLPTANPADYGDATITAKKVYAVCQIDRESIKAAMGNEGAFVDATKHTIQKTVESWSRNASRILFGNSDGVLGVSTAAAAGGSAAAPTIVVSTATWKEANFEENDYVNIGSSNNAYSTSNVWEITGVAPSTRTITLARISGSVDLTGDTAAKTVYLQNSKDNDPMGLKYVCDATSSTLYGISVARRWQATQQDASSAGITTDRINQLMLEVQRKSGKVPDLIVTSFTQYRKIMNMLEDQKQYVVDPRSADLKGKLSFKGLEFMSAAGAVGIFPERFCEDDRLYALNTNYITAYHRPDMGWFEDDGTVFLREASSDAYGARYGGYYQNFIVPSFQGVITSLAT
jgi:hypothetical protein